MTWTLVTTRHFERRARKFLKGHPDLRQAVEEALGKLRQDPYRPALRLHNLGGALAGLQAVSLTYSYRVTLTVQVTQREIVLLDIGSHDDVYR